MLDEREPGVVAPAVPLSPDDVSHSALSVWWRIAIAFGGPVANFLLAIIVYWFLFVLGTNSPAPMFGPVDPASPIGLAGIQQSEEIVAIDDVATHDWQQVNMALAGRLGETGSIVFESRRPGSTVSARREVSITAWQHGVDEPDLFGSLGIVLALPAILGRVLEESPAERGGLRQWDLIESVDAEDVTDWGHFVALVRAAPEQLLTVVVERAGERLTLQLFTDVRSDAQDEAYGYLGVGAHFNEIRYGIFAAVLPSVKETWNKTKLTLGLVKKMVTGHVSVKNLSGPITIAKVARDSARSGWNYFLGILALLSISLGVLNLLPIPILDGGHIAFYLTEVVRGKPVSERTQLIGTQVGLVLVAGLMIFAVYNDIARLFS
jgi:regulator of sigma E protease